MGGDLDPADIILQSVPLIQDPPDFPNHLARVLASLIGEEASVLQDNNERDSSRRLTVLRTALYLAAELPAEESLFSSLKKLLDVLRAIPQEDVGRTPELQLPLWRALAYQQTDASLETEWLSIIEPPKDTPWSPERRTLLLTAWRGLLWIPPNPEEWQSGAIVNYERIQEGLLALSGSIKDREESSHLLTICLDILDETYPRSAQFWSDKFLSPPLPWPKEFRRILSDKWFTRPVGNSHLPPTPGKGEKENLIKALLFELGAVSISVAAVEQAARLIQESNPPSDYEEDLRRINRQFEELREAAIALREEVSKGEADSERLNRPMRKIS